jgi:hypothetical protein
MLSQEVKASACTTAGTTNNCWTIISGLNNNVPYVFKVTVISASRTETQLAGEKTATPTDKTGPAKPTSTKVSLINSQSQLKFSWLNNTDDTSFYRLYHGVMAGQYGESFDSAIAATSLVYPIDQLAVGNHYFSLAALDSYKNESAKSLEINLQRNAADSLTLNNRSYYFSNNNWWYKSSSLSELPNNRACLVELNVATATPTVICDDAAVGTSTQWFVGTIKGSNGYSYCATAGCSTVVNLNRCRHFNGLWSNQCYIHD